MKMRHLAIASLLLGLLAFTTTACNKEERGEIDVEKVIAEKVAERALAFRQSQWADCRQRAMIDAGLLADSILLERARLMRDTSNRPARPIRPDFPVLKSLSDSLKLRPLFDTLR